ncbi:hypothetical protein [Actinomycetospora callitridis]|uniref:hypothetical protein n=1 Tax=Actinomycetospora callitridis TaxID=913944 RepID=UPI0023654DFC|nr:hypothetical protein [Actinomycetospora callitridis]MDD7918468.1 hypothetical protein [Actinomycetospora callitridis]
MLRPLLDDRSIVAATLVDVDSGLVLDGYVDAPDEHPSLADLELLGASHADMVRAAAAVAGPALAELTVSTDDGHHHVLHAVPDPHGDRLVVAVVVRGAARHVARARRRLRTVSVDALTAGPSLAKRPVDGRWVLDEPGPEGPSEAEALDDTGADEPLPAAPVGTSAPLLSAMVPGSATAPPPAASAIVRLSGTVSSVASPATDGVTKGLANGLSSPLVPVSGVRPPTARNGPAGR